MVMPLRTNSSTKNQNLSYDHDCYNAIRHWAGYILMKVGLLLRGRVSVFLPATVPGKLPCFQRLCLTLIQAFSSAFKVLPQWASSSYNEMGRKKYKSAPSSICSPPTPNHAPPSAYTSRRLEMLASWLGQLNFKSPRLHNHLRGLGA